MSMKVSDDFLDLLKKRKKDEEEKSTGDLTVSEEFLKLSALKDEWDTNPEFRKAIQEELDKEREEEKRKKARTGGSAGSFESRTGGGGGKFDAPITITPPKPEGKNGNDFLLKPYEYGNTAAFPNTQLPKTEEKKTFTPVQSPERTWFQKGAFEDGYDPGDVIKTFLATGVDVGNNVGSAVVDATENLIDTGAHVVGTVGGWFDKDFREGTRKFIAKDLLKAEQSGKWVGGVGTGGMTGLASLLSGDSEENSLLGEKSDGLVQSAAHLAGSMALQYVGVPMWATMGVNAFGSELESAYQQDATWGEGTASAAITTAVELASEQIFGGIKFFGGSTADDALKPIIRKISNKAARTAVKLGVDVAGEGAEEILAGLGSAIGQKLTYADEKELSELFSSEEAWESFIGGAVLGGGMGGINAYKSGKAGVDYTTGLTANEEAVVDKIYKDRIAEAEKNGKKLKIGEKAKLYDSIVEEMTKGDLSTDEIDSVLGGDTYKAYKDILDTEESLRKEYDELADIKKSELTTRQEGRLEQIQRKLRQMEKGNEKTLLKSKLDNEMLKRVKGDRLSQSYIERYNRGQAFTADVSKYDEKQQAIIQRAMDSGILNNTRKTHEFVDLIAKISADKGLNFDFTNNARLKESGFAMDGVVRNGYVTKDGITLNVQAAKALNKVVGHEVTHVLEGTELYKELQDAVFKYAQSKGEYDKRLKDITDLYKKYDPKADPKAELTADLVGDYLFTDADFINNLSAKHRNVAQKIYDQIKYMVKVATKGSKEARELEKVKHLFEEAYRNGGKQISDAKNSISETTDGRFVAVVDSDILSNIDTTSWDDTKKAEAKKAASDALKQFSGGIVVDGITRKVNKVSRREYTKSNYTESLYNKAPDVFADKMRAADVVDDIVIAATDWQRDGGLKHPRKDNFVDFDHGKTLIVSGNAKYTAEVVVGITDTGEAVFYDVVDMTPATFDIKKEESPTTATTQKAIGDIQGDSSSVNVAQEPPNVNKQYGLNDPTRNSLSDSEGRQLSNEQSEYFKDSVVRDENGNLKVMYHGTSRGGHTVFDTYGGNHGLFGIGSYFTDSKSIAESYTKKGRGNHPQVYESYLNIKNPIDMDAQANPAEWTDAFPDVQFPESGTNEDFYRAVEEYCEDEMMYKWEAADMIRDGIEVGMGYDGITHIGGGRVNPNGERHRVYITFNAEQIKNTDNVKPTADPDIRFSLNNEVTEEQNAQGLDRKQEVQYSLAKDTKFSDDAIALNNKLNNVDPKVMNAQKVMRERVAKRLREMVEKGVALPADKEGKTFFPNKSYGGTEENTLVCPRSLAPEAFMDAVSEYIGRPLTVEEQIYVGQDLMSRMGSSEELRGQSFLAQCVYCYVAADRMAQREYLGEYINQRDAFLDKVAENPNVDVSQLSKDHRALAEWFKDKKQTKPVLSEVGMLYEEFLDGRKPTTATYKRVKSWIDAYKNGKPMIDGNHLANIDNLVNDLSSFDKELIPQIKDAWKYAQSASWAKTRTSYVAYNGHILKWDQQRINSLNEHYGLRLYSFSDFHPAFVLENMQMITDASVRGLKMLAYTKDMDFVEIFAPSGININVSTFGLEKNGNVYEDNRMGAEWEKAKALREQHPNVGITFVATNDNMVKWAVKQDWIDVVIPYHMVKTGQVIAEHFGYQNYTQESADKKGAIWKNDKNWSRGHDSSIAPTVHNNDLNTYLAALEANGLEPRFKRFLEDPETRPYYMKLVNENRLSASESQPVQPKFNEEAIQRTLARLESEGYYTPIGGSVERMYEIAAEVGESMIAPMNSLSEKSYAEIQEEQQMLYQREMDITERKRKAENNPELLQALDDYHNLFTEMRELLPLKKAGTATQAELDRIEKIKTIKDEYLNRVADLQEKLGLNALSKEADEIRKKKEELRVASDAAWAREGEEKENKAIEKAGVPAPEYFRKKAVRAFKTTTNFNEAGYLLPDGKLLDFSGGERNHRYRDHREIGEIYEATNGVAALNRFLSDGNIRIMAESPGIDLTSGIAPTIDQYVAIRRFVNSNGAKDGKFFVDFSDVDGRRVGNYSYEGRVNADRVINDIKYFYQNGEVRKQSSIGQFLSLSTEGSEHPLGNYNVYGSDIALENTQEDIAPVREDIAPVGAQAEETIYQGVMDQEDVAPVKTAPSDVEPDTRTTRQKLHGNIISRIKSRFEANGFDFDSILKNAKNLSTWSTVDNTPQRVMEKALGYKAGRVLGDITVDQVARNETEAIKWLNSFTDRKNGILAQISKEYKIKPGSKASAAAQMYAEGFYVDDKNQIIKYGNAELAKDFPNVAVQENIKGLASDQRIRKIYDDTLAMINESRTRNAYPEIPRLDNYFLHFRAMDDTFSRLGLPFNPNDIRAKDLPTDLNGVTADLKPGQPYFASAMHRKGIRTSFDLLGGLERYLTSAKNQIFHIDDIQTFRALRNYIADTYGQANGLEGLDLLTEEEAQERISQVYGSHLSTFAKFLNEEANVLAGKTALIDRGLEGIIGRRGITFIDSVNRQVGANMVGFNVSSSLTNFLAGVQAIAKTNKVACIKSLAQTTKSKMGAIFGKTDSFVENNPTIIRRKGADRFYRTPYQKIGDAGYVLMSAVDDVTTEFIVRAKYNEFISKGMSEEQAVIEADKWTSRLMGDRSLGQMPQLYNSKMLGLVTKFQLEVRNQLDSQFYDTIQETKASNEYIQNGLARNAKTAAQVTSTMFQLAVLQHLFGKAFESVAGYNPAFDIIGVLATMFGLDDDEESEDTALDNVEQGFLALLEDLPYTSTFTGGRIPISSALPIKEVVKGVDDYGNEKNRLKTIAEAAPYYILPGGYGQLKKTAQGLSMFDDDHPIAGSYTDKGDLRFPVKDTLGSKVQAGVFGQWASKNAKDYFDKGWKPINEKQQQEFIDSGMTFQEYHAYRDGLKDFTKEAEKVEYINGLDFTDEQKIVLKSYLFDEAGYAEENPEKYAFLESEGIGYLGYKELDSEAKEAWSWAFTHQDEYQYLKENGVTPEDYSVYRIPMLEFEDEEDSAYQWAFDNPEKATFGRVFGDGVKEYRRYASDLSAIKADKDEDGKTINGSAKDKKADYINGLDIDYGQKIILFKSLYKSDDTYNYDIIDYLNSREDISYSEMETILVELGFEVSSDGSITW